MTKEKEMRFSVYQQKKGWGSLFEVTHYGSESYKPSDFFEYHCVATIEADDLEQVFHIGNGMGPQDRLTRIAERMHSISVGDIIMNPEGEFFMCDDFGWAQIEVPSVEEIIERGAA
jgi:hypothetical protein